MKNVHGKLIDGKPFISIFVSEIYNGQNYKSFQLIPLSIYAKQMEGLKK